MKQFLKNKLKGKAIAFVFFIFTFLVNQAQENLKPLGANLHYIYGNSLQNAKPIKESQPVSKSAAGSLLLPFSEDFYYSSTSEYPIQSKWSDSLVYVNSGFAIAPPSIGVATFDGLNKHGYPYTPQLLNQTQSNPADTLTSQPINLYTSATQQTLDPFSDVALSFYYQARGNGDSPEVGDSLIVDFYKPNQKIWQSTVWYSKGNTNSNINDTLFKRAFIRIKDTAYFFDGFRFRFRNRASTVGNFDNWHLDYIYLNQNRADSLADTVVNDITIAEIPTPFLRNYSAMPHNQYVQDEMAPKLSVRIRNNSANQVNMAYKYRIYNSSNTLVFPEYNGGYDNLNPYKRNTFSPPDSGYSNVPAHAFPLVSDTFALMPTDSTDYYIKHFVFLNTGTLASTDANLFNDTVIQFLRFRNYYAYDDGSAEAGYYVNGVGGKMAVKITLNYPDTLRALRIYFDPAGNVSNISGPTSNYFFSLNVWEAAAGGGPGNLILKDSLPQKKPVYYNVGFKEIPEYKLSKPLTLVKGTYYIGIQQKVSTGISVGFDINYNHQSALYYDDGNGWQMSTYKGSLMLHPVFGKEIPPPVGIQKNQLLLNDLYKVYPNPTNNELTIFGKSSDPVQFSFYSITGQLLMQGNYTGSEYHLNTEEFSPGVYFILLQNANNSSIYRQKIVIQH